MMQASSLRLHCTRGVHKLAKAAYLKPEAPLKTLAMTHEEAALLRGCVPQLEDWLMVWQSLNGSFKLAAQHLSTVRWLGNSRGEDKVSELAATSMVQVMAEAVRARHRRCCAKQLPSPCRQTIRAVGALSASKLPTLMSRGRRCWGERVLVSSVSSVLPWQWF